MLNECLYYTIQCLEPNTKSRGVVTTSLGSRWHNKGPSIKYVTLFLANFDTPSPCHTLSHIPGPPESTSHISDPHRFLVGLVQKSRTKVPCTNSISIVRGGFCLGVLSGLVFVHSPFCHNTSVTTES